MYYFSNVATHVALCCITRILSKKSRCTSSSTTDVSTRPVAHCFHCVPEVASLKFMFTWQLSFLVLGFCPCVYIHHKRISPDMPHKVDSTSRLLNLLSCVCSTSSRLHPQQKRWNRLKLIRQRWRNRFKQAGYRLTHSLISSEILYLLSGIHYNVNTFWRSMQGAVPCVGCLQIFW